MSTNTKQTCVSANVLIEGVKCSTNSIEFLPTIAIVKKITKKPK